MKLYQSWFPVAGLRAALPGSERRPSASMTRLAAVTREIREAMEAEAQA